MPPSYFSFCCRKPKQSDSPPPAPITKPIPVAQSPPAVVEMTKVAASSVVAASLTSGGAESVGFLNDIIEQLWDYINVAGSAMAKEIAEPMFKEMLPGPLSSLHFVKIDLGKVPIKFDNVDVHKREKGAIKLDIDVKWDGQCDIELAANIIGSFGVERIKLDGRMSIMLGPIVDRMPLITAAQIAFVNPPFVELDFTGLAQVADLAIIDKTIRNIIQNVLASILVLPNRLLIKLDPGNDYYKTYHPPLGFIRLTVVSGQGFKVPKGFLKDVPDVYCNLRLGANPEWSTSTKNNDVAPVWNESVDFLLADHDQRITVEVMDDDLTGDDKLGTGELTVNDLLLAGKTKELPLFVSNSNTGATITLKCDVYQFVPNVTSFELADADNDNLKCGLITILVAGVTSIPGVKSECMTSVAVTYGTDDFTTPIICDMPGQDPLNPCFDCSFRILLSSKQAAQPSDISFTLKNGKECIDSIVVPYSDVLNAPDLCLRNKFPFKNGSILDASVSIQGTHITE